MDLSDVVVSKTTQQGVKKRSSKFTLKKRREEMMRKGKERIGRFKRSIKDNYRKGREKLSERLKNMNDKRQQRRITSEQSKARQKKEIEAHFNAMTSIYESLSEQDKSLSVKELTEKTNKLFKQMLDENFRKFVDAVKREKPKLNVSELILEDVWILSSTAAGVEGSQLDDERFDLRKQKALELLNELTNPDDDNEHVNKFKEQIESSIKPPEEEKAEPLDERPKEEVSKIAQSVDCPEDDIECINNSTTAKQNLNNISKVKTQYRKGQASIHDLNELTTNVDEEHEAFTFLKTAAKTTNIKKQITKIKNEETDKIRQEFDAQIIKVTDRKELDNTLKEYDDKLKSIVMVYNISMKKFGGETIDKQDLKKSDSYINKEKELKAKEATPSPDPESRPSPPSPDPEATSPPKTETIPSGQPKNEPEKQSQGRQASKVENLQSGGRKTRRRKNRRRRTRKGGRKNVRKSKRTRKNKKSNKKRRRTRRR